MAYDPKDPADKKILADAIAEALADAETEHETAVAGLKAKNAELIAKNKELKKGQPDADAIERLEGEIETLTAKVKEGEKSVKALTKERDTLKVTAETESAAARKLLVDGGLTEALAANNIAPQFLPAVKAMLSSQVTIKAEGETRTAMVGDKPLSEFVKAWSQGDDGKIYVAAPNNRGGAAPGGKATGTTGKTVLRSVWDGMDHVQRAASAKEGTTVVDG